MNSTSGCWAMGTHKMVRKKYFVLGWPEQPKQDKCTLYRHDEPYEHTKEGPLSFVIFESPFTSVSTVSRGHPSLRKSYVKRPEDTENKTKKEGRLEDNRCTVQRLLHNNDILFEKSLFYITHVCFEKYFWSEQAVSIQDWQIIFAFWARISLLQYFLEKLKIQVSEAFRLWLAELCTVDFSLAKTIVRKNCTVLRNRLA